LAKACLTFTDTDHYREYMENLSHFFLVCLCAAKRLLA